MQARGADDLVLKVWFSNALLASALANPADRKERLAEAASVFDSLPPTMRSWKAHAIVREEIAREQNTKP